MVPDENLSLARGAIVPGPNRQHLALLPPDARSARPSLSPADDHAVEDAPQGVREVILFGSGEEEITFVYDDGVRPYKTTKPFEGVISNIERRWRETETSWVREELSRFQSDHPCEACNGYRLKPQALAVKIAGLHIGQVTEMSIREAARWFARSAGPAHAEAERDRRAHPQGDPRPARNSSTMSASNISRCRAPRARCRAARASASGSPRRSARG